MTERGKFCSLTLVNWNGFFARTFDLDVLVTTLSGGNGAGKSTTMAAFITALIPDLTLLHFRNTTEAGATSGSRDKGLHGKLCAGVCYALLEVVNSRQQKVLLGVRLQQIAGRDRKVDLKSFAIQGITGAAAPTELLTTQVVTAQIMTAQITTTQVVATTDTGRQARVLSLAELKERAEGMEGVQFTQFNSIADYHSLMFDLGVIPKRLRSTADRSKFYRLIEASLYGGISSAIQRSLRDYLLPENSGVRKAFQDMEAALRENRMTLAAIRVTQADRDLFKHLISEATCYVAADYMRHANERRGHLEAVLALRRDRALSMQQHRAQLLLHAESTRELEVQSGIESALETDYQLACDHLNRVQTAVQQQEKIERWQNESEELSWRLTEQHVLVAESAEQQAAYLASAEAAEQEVDGLRNQLADYQQALDAQQTRAIQYQQAVAALERAQKICPLPEGDGLALSPECAALWLQTFQQQEQAATELLLSCEQKLSVAEVAHSQFAQAYQLVCSIAGAVNRSESWQCAHALLRDWPARVWQAEQVAPLRTRLSELQQRLQTQQDAQRLLQLFCQRRQKPCLPAELTEIQNELELQAETLALAVSDANDHCRERQQDVTQLKDKILQLRARAPAWLLAQDALTTLREQNNETLHDSGQLTAVMQQLLERERETVVARDAVTTQLRQTEAQIECLNQPHGADDARLVTLAERFGGVLLSEIYDDIALDDAPYFSALYGPARHGIVVPDLSQLREQLSSLQDCPEDLWLIEGDPLSFDDTVFVAEEQKNAVIVKTADRQWRYSRYPQTPLFGRAARENRLETLRSERDALAQRYAALSFEVQKIQRAHQALGHFVGMHLAVAFDADPEAEIRQLSCRHSDIERALRAHEEQKQQQQQQIEQVKEGISTLNRLIPLVELMSDDTLPDSIKKITTELAQAQDASEYLRLHGITLKKLEPLHSALQNDPEQHGQLQEDYLRAQHAQKRAQQQVFALTEVVQRRSHFSYTNSAEIPGQALLNEQLRQQLEQAQTQRTESRERLQQHQAHYNQSSQQLASLKSALETKRDMLRELIQELNDLGVPGDAGAIAHASTRRDEIHTALGSHRLRHHQLEKQLIFCETETNRLQQKLRTQESDYHRMRTQAVRAKAGWCRVQALVKDNTLERRLQRRELAYMHADELRSMSDKALGALRLAVADNEHLRDALRLSENPKWPERKIEFYIAVYQHLRERIRQDIIRTDDPADAIEQMETELCRLTEELSLREKTLAISSKTVASIIDKTIVREQNRVRMLNQGLQAVAFGQVKSVRLNIRVRQAHTTLLQVLSEQQEQHQDLFNSHRLSFSEALAKLYQRLNPHIDMGQRLPQTVGEELLDYRNYLDLEVEVFRGTEGWLRAESGALSTGEAIGTGMSILVMVVQSWEEESRRLRSKDIAPCRLLFLDEAARLDAKSIATLFELCERLEMQLIIAAPENISPEKGTTYKLVRKVFNQHEHVHVIGLRGFTSTEIKD